MKTQTHTPGPWYTEAFDCANGTAESVYALVDDTPVEIADCSPDFPDGGVANARLISAAPDMAKALRLTYMNLCALLMVTEGKHPKAVASCDAAAKALEKAGVRL